MTRFDEPGTQQRRRRVVIDGVSLAYDDEGQGSAVVCLHAIGHGAADFAALRERWRGRRRVLALDWPGQGDSGGDRGPASAGRYAALLEGFLNATGVERAVVIGNSIGGAAAICFAAAHPGRVRALILENPGGLDRLGPTHWLARAFLGAMARFHRAGERRAWWYPGVFGVYYRSVLQRRAAAARRRDIAASAWEIAPVLAQAWMSFAAPEADLRPLASRVVCPVLFAWATWDHTVTLGRSRAAIRMFPDARLERFRAGHAAHLETPESFAAAAERFLADVETRRDTPEPVATVCGSSGGEALFAG